MTATIIQLFDDAATVAQEPWIRPRDALVKALDKGAGLVFCWRVLEHVAALYQTSRGVPFLALPASEREAMRYWLTTLN